MNKKFSINEILDAVNSINSVSNHHKVKKNNAIKKTKTISFEKPLLLSRIIKYKPTNTKSLFLNKLHNSKIKIITMMPPGASK